MLYQDFIEKKVALRAAFKDMRKAGLMARMNYMCCQNCAGYAMTTEAVKRIDAGTPQEDIKGCVFYHNQDNANLERDRKFYLAYGNMDSTEYGTIGLPTETVGQIVVEILDKYDIKTEWDGNASSRIFVDLEAK